MNAFTKGNRQDTSTASLHLLNYKYLNSLQFLPTIQDKKQHISFIHSHTFMQWQQRLACYMPTCSSGATPINTHVCTRTQTHKHTNTHTLFGRNLGLNFLDRKLFLWTYSHPGSQGDLAFCIYVRIMSSVIEKKNIFWVCIENYVKFCRPIRSADQLNKITFEAGYKMDKQPQTSR